MNNMLVPVYTVGKVLPKEIKEKIIRREYNVNELNNIYKAIIILILLQMQ